MKKILCMLLMSLLLLLPLAASAVKLYKWVDKDGNVTYQELPPPSDASKVEEKNINPDANVIQAEHPALSTSTSSGSAGGSVPVPADDSSTTTETTVPAPVLQQGDVSGTQAANPLPALAPAPVLAPPAALAPPPVQPPPPALPPPPPPPPRGAH